MARRGTPTSPLSETEVQVRTLRLVLDFHTKLASLQRAGVFEQLTEGEMHLRLARLRGLIDSILESA